jgi:predicted dehydrogenase
MHALALRSAGVRIAAVHDPDVDRARWLADLTQAAVVDDLAIDVDVVAICSPPQHHVEQAEMLARADRLVFVEKPVATTLVDLGRLAVLPNVVPIVQWRAGRSARELRAAFADGTFGARSEIECELRLWRDAEYFAARADWGCGALLSIGIHAIDLVTWMVGRPILRATRTESIGRAKTDIPTRGRLEIDFDGAHATIRISLDEVGRNDVRLFVRGARASAELAAGEADPTATPLRWHGAAPRAVEGATGSPLLVPYIHEALARRAPSIADVLSAHTLVLGENSHRAMDRTATSPV